MFKMAVSRINKENAETHEIFFKSLLVSDFFPLAKTSPIIKARLKVRKCDQRTQV